MDYPDAECGPEYYEKHSEAIADFVKEHYKSPQTRKNIFSGAYLITGMEFYQKEMKADCQTINKGYMEQKLTPKEREHRITFEQVKER
jgi:hypothetical protein